MEESACINALHVAGVMHVAGVTCTWLGRVEGRRPISVGQVYL